MKNFLELFNKNQGLISVVALLIPLLSIIFGQRSTAIAITSVIFLIALISWCYFFIHSLIMKRLKFTIINARYGSDKTLVDMTDQLSQFIIDNKLEIHLTNGIVGDPTPGRLKVGYIKYQIGNSIKEVKCKERDLLKLP